MICYRCQGDIDDPYCEREEEALRANLREAWSALAMLRETVETLAPIGSVTAAEYLDSSTFMHEADALVFGIIAIASESNVSNLRERSIGWWPAVVGVALGLAATWAAVCLCLETAPNVLF